jgi:hypothetical protein
MALTKVIGAGLGSVSSADLDGAVTINESSADKDFRVESNGSANMLFVNGGNNQVGIGVDAASTVFHVETSTDGTGVSGDELYIAKFYNREATDDRSYGIDIHAGSTATDQSLRVKDHDGTNEHFLIKGNGEVNISRDNIVFKTAGKGVYLGVTSATSSNLLDDYEEGTWTPACQYYEGTPTIENAYYTKIGRKVVFSCKILLDGTSDGSNFRITGLPFTTLNTGSGVFGAFLSYSNGGAVAYSLIGANQTQINNYDSNGSNISYNTAGGNKEFRFVGMYITA